MKKHYTTLDIQNGQFIGSVFDANNNQLLYKTKPHLTQLQVAQELNTYMQTQKPAISEQSQPLTPQQPAKQVSLIKPMRGRCCGR